MLQSPSASIESRASWVVASVALVTMMMAFGAAWITAVALKDIAAKERFAQLFGQTPHQDPMPQQVAELPATPPPALPDPAPEASGAAAVVAEAAQTLLQPAEDPAPVEAEVVQAVVDKPVAELPTRFDAPVEAAKYVSISDAVRRAAEQERHSGRSNAVVQLGAYSSPERVEVAWKLLTKRYPALRGYEPMKARFNSARGPVWRLSIKGFDNRNEAVDRCEELQGNGGNCFVRTAAGDAPVQLASR